MAQEKTRRSTSALLADENIIITNPRLEQQPLLECINPGDEPEKVSCYQRFNTRYVVAIWVFLGFICLYMLRVNLSVAIVAMSAPQNAKNKSSQSCPSHSNTSKNSTEKHGTFHWTPSDQGQILGAFFYGYVISQLIGGALAERFGAKWIFGVGLLLAAITTFFIPISGKDNYAAIFALRVLIGIFEGPAFPSSGALWGKWVPPYERSIIPPIAHSGKEIGVIITTPVAGLLCSSDFLGGWPAAFYVFGLITCLWFICWCFLGYNNPDEHPRCSIKEKLYLSSVLPKPRKLKTPWKQILRSLPFWSIGVVITCVQFVYYVLLTSLPTYFATILNFNLQKNGVMFAIPYIFMMIVIVSTGQIADYVRSRRILSTTVVRKIQTLIGGIGSSAFLVLVGYVGCNEVAAMCCITAAVAFLGVHASGCQISHLDIASNHAGILIGITNTLAAVPGIVAPLIVGAITNNNQTLHAWQLIFNVSAGIGLFGCIFYLIFFDGNEQSWNRTEYEEL